VETISDALKVKVQHLRPKIVLTMQPLNERRLLKKGQQSAQVHHHLAPELHHEVEVKNLKVKLFLAVTQF
jgi:hypothetical protein